MVNQNINIFSTGGRGERGVGGGRRRQIRKGRKGLNKTEIYRRSKIAIEFSNEEENNKGGFQ